MFFWKNKKKVEQPQKNKPAIKSWFNDHYETVLVQRNIAVLLSFICIILIFIAVVAVMKISLARNFEPFVIQIEEKTGATRVVNPVGIEVLNTEKALAQYFIKLYISARETYNPVDFEIKARQTIKLLSNNNVYWSYLNFINRKENDPRLIYGQRETTTLKVRSWSELPDRRFIVRIAIHESISGKVFNKIVVVQYQYVPMELSPEEFDINPVGFQIIGYRIDDDYS
ncbi:type VI secretion protein [Orientia tsutsugamushi]|uniref:Type VI secretion protein n=1 Tax=Orientia tsutsugamushi TaxID=784 RepID=A0A2R8F4J8_ORITS|nr:VirB8/TrbF family protein [Orientia tsutsugamushi]SPM46168.1 type VI secretion protein [Orientia tsutsugamushi]